jgi:hypothetical protein
MALQLLSIGSVGVNPLGAKLEWNPATFPVAKIVMTGNASMDSIGTLQSGATYVLIIQQDSVGGRSLTWGPQFKWSGGIPLLSPAPNAIDIASFISDGTNLFGSLMVNFQ